MSVKQSSEIAQEVMESLLNGHDTADVYIDHVGCY